MWIHIDNEDDMTQCHDKSTLWQDDIHIWQYDTDIMTWHNDIRLGWGGWDGRGIEVGMGMGTERIRVGEDNRGRAWEGRGSDDVDV